MYNEKLPSFGDLITVEQFIEASQFHYITDWDGHGHAVKDDMMNAREYIMPSRPQEIPEDATHILWFNK